MWIALHTFVITLVALTKLVLAAAGIAAGFLTFAVASGLMAAAWLVAAAPREV